MDLVFPETSTAGYNPGDVVSGLLKYNITSQQETVYDVRLDFDGRAVTTPFKLKYEAHRSKVSLIEQSQTLFQGPSTMNRQLLAWPFSFTIPAIATAEGSSVPLPPSMDYRFGEGILVKVEYSITATVRLNSDYKSRRQQTKIISIRPSTALRASHQSRDTVLFPSIKFQTGSKFTASRSSFQNIFKANSSTQSQTLRLEMTLPSTLLYDQHENITCCLRGATESENTLSDPKFTFELVLQSRLAWQNHLELRQHIGTTTKRPDIEIQADGQSVSLSDIGLQDFAPHRGSAALLQSYDCVIPEVSLGFSLAAMVALRHEISGRLLILRASVPVAAHSSVANSSSPPAYQPCMLSEETIPPPYA